MFLVALVLAVSAGVFFGAGNSALPWSNDICRYGDVLCQHPSWVGIPAVLSLIWAFFLRVDRL
ncbi:MAG TPA: hypothetical protein VGC77_21870 [Rhodopseudomonas sp.]|uniref:hypothetical protein n=1 Tax=Rhodopseudomonas sp. TaxID=1078 RepID=UPI002ED98479